MRKEKLLDMTAPHGADEPEQPFEVEAPDVTNIVIDDETPVDNPLSEKQMRLLTEPLYTSWEGPPERADEEHTGAPRLFIAAANVGLFATPHEDPLVPDVFLSLDVEWHRDIAKEKRHRTYFFWEIGKPPDVVIEIVSNKKGGELGRKKRRYARMRVLYYVVWDPLGMLGEPALHSFELRGDLYVPMAEPWFEAAGLGLTEWNGWFEHMEYDWLRWARRDGSVIATGAERAESAETRAASAETRAASAETRAASAEAKAAELVAKLRALGIEPEDG